MKLNLKAFLFIVIFSTTLLINKNVKAETSSYNDKTYKVGIVEFAPYAEVNEKGEFEGYYIDFFDLIGKELNLKYEYVLVNSSEDIKKLEEGELDICLGITITDSRTEKLLFNVNPIAFEKYALYAEKDIDSYNFSKLNGLRFGAVRERATNWILEFFKASNISIEVVYGDSYDEINELLDNGSIDLLLDSAYKESKYKKIYEFVESQVYIAANKANKDLINDIDNTIIKINRTEENKLDKLYDSYFDKDKLKKEKIENALNLLLELIPLIIAIITLLPRIKRWLYKIYVKSLIKKGRYSIYYEPIYKVKTKELVGFEALVKDKIKDKSLLHSKDLISKFEGKNSVSELCIWELEKIVSNYDEFKKYDYLSEKEFYISLNIPINQFKNNKFVDKIIKILNKAELHKNSICIEVMGNINVESIDTIIKNIKRLKESGFIIAIDDFGIEYSNLNMIIELDIDIIKIDKAFTYNIDSNSIKNEIILFISRIGKAQDKFVVLEGIDKLEQDEKVREIDNDKLCVQGEFYSKPISIENIKYGVK